MTTSTADLWHHYGRARATRDRAVPGTFYWSWGQDAGPGPEVLGDLTGRCVGDLGAGAARHAAHLAVHQQPAQVVAVDASPAQHAMATDLHAHLAPRLRLVQSGAVPHLQAMTGTYDVLYSVFGAVDFTEPRELLPAAATALKPGGRTRGWAVPRLLPPGRPGWLGGRRVRAPRPLVTASASGVTRGVRRRSSPGAACRPGRLVPSHRSGRSRIPNDDGPHRRRKARRCGRAGRRLSSGEGRRPVRRGRTPR